MFRATHNISLRSIRGDFFYEVILKFSGNLRGPLRCFALRLRLSDAGAMQSDGAEEASVQVYKVCLRYHIRA